MHKMLHGLKCILDLEQSEAKKLELESSLQAFSQEKENLAFEKAKAEEMKLEALKHADLEKEVRTQKVTNFCFKNYTFLFVLRCLWYDCHRK